MKDKFNYLYHARKIFNFNRSITGEGVRETLRYIKKNINNNLKIKHFKSGEKYFDWRIPNEWLVKKATLKYRGKEILNFKKNNLCLVGYSVKKKKILKLSLLKKNIYFNKQRPNATPYVTSYYHKNWGFCMPYNKFKSLKEGNYEVDIDTKHFRGKMDYGEIYIKGKSKKEILITSYTCHPSLANNELSGPLVLSSLAKKLKASKYSIRLILIPETIGAIAFISKHLNHLKSNLIAGINLTCVGKKGPHTILKSISENTYADVIAKRISKKFNVRFLSFKERGSNERQFGCQNLNLPFITYCRKKFGEYPEYHTSDDNLSIIDDKTLEQSKNFIFNLVSEIQKNKIYLKSNNCEPFLSKYNLWEKIRHKTFAKENRDIFNIIAYASRNKDLKKLQSELNINKNNITEYINLLKDKKLIREFL